METPLDKKIEELRLKCLSVKPLPTFKETLTELAQWVIEQVKMEGIVAKMTPFQSTVDTYIKNRAIELGIK